MYNWNESIEQLYLAKFQYNKSVDLKEKTRLLHKLSELISKKYEESIR